MNAVFIKPGFVGLPLGYWASLVAQRVKCLPAMWETRVRSLGREDPLEMEMATHSSPLAWRIPWTEEPERLQSTGSQRVGHDWATSLSFLSFFWSDNRERFSVSGFLSCLPNVPLCALACSFISFVASPTHFISWVPNCFVWNFLVGEGFLPFLLAAQLCAVSLQQFETELNRSIKSKRV